MPLISGFFHWSGRPSSHDAHEGRPIWGEHAPHIPNTVPTRTAYHPHSYRLPSPLGRELSPVVPVTLPTGEGPLPTRTEYRPHSYQAPSPVGRELSPHVPVTVPTRTRHHPQRSLQSLIAGASVKIEAFA